MDPLKALHTKLVNFLELRDSKVIKQIKNIHCTTKMALFNNSI